MEQKDGTQKGANSEKLPRLNKTCLNKMWSEGERTSHGNVEIKHPAEIGVDKCAHLQQKIQAATNALQNYKQSLVSASEEAQTCHKKLQTYNTQHVQLEVERFQLMKEGEGIEQQMKETKEPAKLRKLQCQAELNALKMKHNAQEIQWVQSKLHELSQQYQKCQKEKQDICEVMQGLKSFIRQQEYQLLQQRFPGLRLPPIRHGRR